MAISTNMSIKPENNNQGRSYVVRGGNPLKGEISVSGAKNAATKQMVACLLTSDPVTLKNIPQIGDVDATVELLEELGVKIAKDNQNYTITADQLKTPQVSAAFSRKNRIPFF